VLGSKSLAKSPQEVLMENKPVSGSNGVCKQLTDSSGSGTVAFCHATAEAMRIRIVEQRGADVVGPLYDHDLFTFDKSPHNHVKICCEYWAITFPDIGQDAKKMMRT
jgi:hypothetical protein